MDTMEIIFEQENADCLTYGKLRRGKIIITFTGKYRDSLSVITTTFDQYYVNNMWIQGTMIVINNGVNESGNMTFSIEVKNAKIIEVGGKTINWEAMRNKEWISGYNTFENHDDDKYLISGFANGNNTIGQEFEVNITKDLLVDLSCLEDHSNRCVITSGEAELIPNGFSTRIINYGDSICDCNYSVTLNKTEYFLVVD